MHTVRLKIHDKIYEKLIWLLNKFSEDELEIISEDDGFSEARSYVEMELKEIHEGKAQFASLAEAEERLEKLLKDCENSL